MEPGFGSGRIVSAVSPAAICEKSIQSFERGNFVSFDFETANNSRLSACQIGLVVYEEGQEVSHFVSFIKPMVPGFIHTGIHGIGPNHVQDAPDFRAVYNKIGRLLWELPWVAHNMPFDFGVLKASLAACHISLPESGRLCTVQASRQALVLPNYRLSTVADYFRLPLNHHEALSDARACGNIASALLGRVDLKRLVKV